MASSSPSPRRSRWSTRSNGAASSNCKWKAPSAESLERLIGRLFRSVYSPSAGLIDDLLSDEPRPALAAYRRLADDHLPWLERRAVLVARQEGIPWAVIGRLLRRSRQTVQQKFDRAFPVGQLTPVPRPLPPGPEDQLYYDLLLADFARDRFVDEAGDDGSLVPW